MKVKAYIIVCFLFFSIISCIDNGTPQGNKENTGKIMYPEENRRKVTVFGYGYMRGKSKTAVERFAMNYARVSIAEQAKGRGFTIKVKDSEISFSSDTGEVALGGIKTEEKKIWKQGDEWEMFVVQSAKIEVEIPKGSGVVIREEEGEGKDMSVLLAELRGHALLNAVKKNRELQNKSILKGHMYLAFLEVSPLEDKPGVFARANFAIIFYDN